MTILGFCLVLPQSGDGAVWAKWRSIDPAVEHGCGSLETFTETSNFSSLEATTAPPVDAGYTSSPCQTQHGYYTHPRSVFMGRALPTCSSVVPPTCPRWMPHFFPAIGGEKSKTKDSHTYFSTI